MQVPLKGPDARLSDSFVQQGCVITKNGYKNFAKPIGTGPFKFKSFEIGVRSLCVRNPDYWQNGKPYVDEWEDISIDDNSARLNALLGGQIDMMSQLDFAQAKAQKKTKKIQVIDAPSPAYQVFIMRVDRPPFNDVNVRQAMRLIVDRQALINVALGGFGTVGNDLFGYNLPYYAKSLKPREQDIDQAKSLLKKAGKSNLAVTLQTSDIVPGFTQAATLFAQQAQGSRRQDHDQEGSRPTRTSTRRSCTRRWTSRSRTGRRARWPRSTASRSCPARPGTRPTSRIRRSTRWCARPPARARSTRPPRPG